MSTIYVAAGTGSGPTEVAAYDAALADAGVHNYNLVTVSSIVPSEATVTDVDVVPDRGPAGDRLTVVEARTTTAAAGPIAAGLGWATGPGPGLFYEAVGSDADAVRREIRDGLDAGRNLRDWTVTEESTLVATATGTSDPDEYVTALVVAAYGESEPIL
jgi:arginine decarboxylase